MRTAFDKTDDRKSPIHMSPIIICIFADVPMCRYASTGRLRDWAHLLLAWAARASGLPYRRAHHLSVPCRLRAVCVVLVAVARVGQPSMDSPPPSERSPRSAKLERLAPRAQIIEEIQHAEYCCKSLCKWGTGLPSVLLHLPSLRTILIALLRCPVNRPSPDPSDGARHRDAAYAGPVRPGDLHTKAEHRHPSC